ISSDHTATYFPSTTTTSHASNLDPLPRSGSSYANLQGRGGLMRACLTPTLFRSLALP
ncbi:hypothetical protein HPP92_028893, partial [Vanilla planifolia]